MLTGDARAADPVCTKSPMRDRVDAIVARAERGDIPDPSAQPLVFRDPVASRRLAGTD